MPSMLFPNASASTSKLDQNSLNSSLENAPSIPNTEGSGLKGLFSQMLDGNPYFSAGFGLMGVGAALALLRSGVNIGSTVLRRRLLVQLEISSKDPAYLWFLQWISARTSSSRIKSHQLAVETSHRNRPDGGADTAFSLVPGPGTHYFKYGPAWFQVKRERDGKMMDLTSGTPWETVMLTGLSRDRTLFAQMLNEARSLAQKNVVGKTIIYTAWAAEWRPFGQPRSRRSITSVILDFGIKEKIIEDVKNFMSRGVWYSERGIPYRRGYLLYGPPGSGKSSFIQALAGELEYNICVLNLSERGLTDDKLNHLLANAPERSFILLEDIDAAFSKREQADDRGFTGSNVTFSGLLNALDGVASSTSQRLVFMTTNHPERLDSALVRPGRVDLSTHLGNATPYQARTLFKRFYSGSLGNEDEVDALAERLANEIASESANGQSVSMAALQGHFIRTEPQEAVETWTSLLSNSLSKNEAEKFVIPSLPS